MDEELKYMIINGLLEGLIFIEKVGEKLLNEELDIEQKNIVKSFTKLLSILENTQPLCNNSNTESTKSLPVIEYNEELEITLDNASENSPTQRKPESLPPIKSNDDYLILEEDQTCFTMQSDLPSYRYTRLYISVNNNFKGMYYCVLEKSFILLGLELNNLPPEYVIPLEKYKISEEMGKIIKLVNNGIEIAMQFELESECKSWLESTCNAQSSVYSYVRLQEIENNSPPETVPFITHTDIKPPALPPKIGSIDSFQKSDLMIPDKGRMSKSTSLNNITKSLPFCYDPPLAITRAQSPNRRERPLPPPPLPPPNKEFTQSISDFNRENIKPRGLCSLPQTNIYPDGLPLTNSKSIPLTSNGKDITKLEKSRVISQSKESV